MNWFYPTWKHWEMSDLHRGKAHGGDLVVHWLEFQPKMYKLVLSCNGEKFLIHQNLNNHSNGHFWSFSENVIQIGL